MAVSTTMYPVVSATPGLYIVAGAFKPNGSSAIDNDNNFPPGTSLFTAARSTTGVYTVTLTQKPNRIHSVTAYYMASTASARKIALNSVVDSTGVITLTHLDHDAVATQIDAAGDDGVSAGADATWDATTGTHVDDASDHLIAGAAAMTAAADIAAASGTMVHFVAICEDSSITVKEI